MVGREHDSLGHHDSRALLIRRDKLANGWIHATISLRRIDTSNTGCRCGHHRSENRGSARFVGDCDGELGRARLHRQLMKGGKAFLVEGQIRSDASHQLVDLDACCDGALARAGRSWLLRSPDVRQAQQHRGDGGDSGDEDCDARQGEGTATLSHTILPTPFAGQLPITGKLSAAAIGFLFSRGGGGPSMFVVLVVGYDC